MLWPSQWGDPENKTLVNCFTLQNSCWNPLERESSECRHYFIAEICWCWIFLKLISLHYIWDMYFANLLINRLFYEAKYEDGSTLQSVKIPYGKQSYRWCYLWQWKKKILDGNQSYLWCSLLAMREENIRWQSVISLVFFIGNERRIYRMAISHYYYVLYWQWEKNISGGNQS